jgi:hypothetical protein
MLGFFSQRSGYTDQSNLSDKFRIGAQGYTRGIGSLDDFRPEFDRAYADYKFACWFGLRGGKVLFTVCSLCWIGKQGPPRLVRILPWLARP